MYKGRRDYRTERIFTIDPTTAKDLDDALHVKQLPDGRVEIGVHIADVSFFIQPGTAVDQEAQKRATTVYLVDRTVPMLPRPLCEVACSLNENVERLAFSCVWTMNMDGTLKKKGDKVSEDDVWYGRTVIKSCARLDYSTAQNIIDRKVAHGESESELDEKDWPKSRRPTGGHTIDEVAFDVRLMHVVAMARRKLRFDNGALALHGIKLTFQLDSDGQTPLLAAPYPIRDSNRLIEEYMLLANYLVAQRLISHAKGKALLRQHPEPLDDGLDKVVEVAKASINFDMDVSTSATLHASLHRLSRECDDPLVLQSITQMLMTPMQPADYFAAGQVEPMLWRHFALNIPYYTHFTSPIRRYPDVIVHRLLQATLDGDQAVDSFPQDSAEINQICIHCNEMRMKSKTAQERCDRVFLSLYVLKNPMKSELGVVMSVGVKTFNVYVPSLGISTMLFLDEHLDELTSQYVEAQDGARRITLNQKAGREGIQWGTIDIKVFTKLLVTVFCKDKPPIDVGLKLEGPWSGG
jgi:VacB/RNase II family 3'-5' exoribonuclease